MSYRATFCRLLVLVFAANAGCALTSANKSASPDSPAGSQNSATNSVGAPAASAVQASTNRPGPATTATAGATPDPRVLDDVLAELATLGPIQPEVQQQLIDDLRKTDPAYWPMLIQTVRASLAYRRRAAQREAQATKTAVVTDDTRAETSPHPGLGSLRDEQPAGREQIASAVEQVAYAAPIDSVSQAPSGSSAKDTDESRAPPAVLSPVASPAGASPAIPSGDAGAQNRTAWQQHLAAAIGELDRETRDHPQATDALANQIYLRLLDLMAGRRDDALRPIPGISASEQDYWSKQLFALSTYLDRDRIGDPTRRAGEAGLHLSKALAALSEQGPLVVRNLTFCTDVHSYGVMKRFEPAHFKSGQQVLVYAEVENFKSEEAAEGFHTLLEASYAILDGQGRRVAHDDLPLTEEHCQNRRRDFFVHYFVTLPKTIYEGNYTLQLTIEDKLGHKIGQSPIEFSVKEKK